MKPLFGRQRVIYWRGKKFVLARRSVLIPIIRKMYPAMIAEMLCGVQPMDDRIFADLAPAFKIRYILPKKKQKWVDKREARLQLKKDRLYHGSEEEHQDREASGSKDQA